MWLYTYKVRVSRPGGWCPHKYYGLTRAVSMLEYADDEIRQVVEMQVVSAVLDRMREMGAQVDAIVRDEWKQGVICADDFRPVYMPADGRCWDMPWERHEVALDDDIGLADMGMHTV